MSDEPDVSASLEEGWRFQDPKFGRFHGAVYATRAEAKAALAATSILPKRTRIVEVSKAAGPGWPS